MYPQLRTRPSPLSPRGDELLETISLSYIWHTQIIALGFPAIYSFRFLRSPKLCRQEYHMV